MLLSKSERSSHFLTIIRWTNFKGRDVSESQNIGPFRLQYGNAREFVTVFTTLMGHVLEGDAERSVHVLAETWAFRKFEIVYARSCLRQTA